MYTLLTLEDSKVKEFWQALGVLQMVAKLEDTKAALMAERTKDVKGHLLCLDNLIKTVQRDFSSGIHVLSETAVLIVSESE